MNSRPHPVARISGRRAQVIVIFAILLPVFIGFFGLALDTILIYRSNAILSRAVDATSLRLARKFNAESELRKKVGLTMAQANYPGFLDGYDISAFTSSGAIIDSTGETLAISNSRDSLTINTRASSAQGAITVTVSATTIHTTFFMRLFGTKFSTVPIEENATATRFPSVNVLVLDLSGSMLDNGGAEGLITGVKDFIREFDETRDFMLVIGYNDNAKILWPNVAYSYGNTNVDSSGNGIATGIDSSVGPITGLHYYKPSRDFQSGLGSLSTQSIESVMDTQTAYWGYTNCAEAIRLGAECVDKWLQNDVPASIRDELYINFIVFTDGEFNTLRTYVKGPGYGRRLNNRNQNESNGNPNGSSRLSIHNTFHNYAPLVARTLNTTYEGKNLSTILGSYTTPETIEGINVCWTPWATRILKDPNNDAQHVLSDSSVTWRDDYISGSNIRNRWINQFYLPYRSFAYHSERFMGNTGWSASIPSGNRISGGAGNQFRSLGFLMDNAHNSSNNRTQLTQVTNAILEGEKYKLRHLPYLFFPAAPTNEYINACSGRSYTSNLTRNGQTYYHLPAAVYSHWNSIPKSEREFEYFPGSRIFANHYDSYQRETWNGAANRSARPLAPSRSKFSWIFERTSNNDKIGWFRAFGRLADYYLDYSIGGEPDFNGDMRITARNNDSLGVSSYNLGMPYYQETNVGNTNNNVSNNNERNFVDGDSDHRPLLNQWWSFRRSEWRSVNTNDAVTEAYWLSQAQAYLLRTQYDATFYTIVYGNNGNQNEMRKMANDPSSGSFDADQPEGKYYKTGESSDQLTAVFREIASLIAVKLTD